MHRVIERGEKTDDHTVKNPWIGHGMKKRKYCL